MQWLDLNTIKKTIIFLRKKEFDDTDSLFFQEQLLVVMQEIEQQREKGMELLDYEENILKKMCGLLEIEAIVLSMIETLIYSPSGYAFHFSFEQNKKYIFGDYFEMVSYYSSEFSEFSFLANFYLTKIDE